MTDLTPQQPRQASPWHHSPWLLLVAAAWLGAVLADVSTIAKFAIGVGAALLYAVVMSTLWLRREYKAFRKWQRRVRVELMGLDSAVKQLDERLRPIPPDHPLKQALERATKEIQERDES
jgi:hypothetical protein